MERIIVQNINKFIFYDKEEKVLCLEGANGLFLPKQNCDNNLFRGNTDIVDVFYSRNFELLDDTTNEYYLDADMTAKTKMFVNTKYISSLQEFDNKKLVLLNTRASFGRVIPRFHTLDEIVNDKIMPNEPILPFKTLCKKIGK